jgi:hypothetical protein
MEAVTMEAVTMPKKKMLKMVGRKTRWWWRWRRRQRRSVLLWA